MTAVLSDQYPVHAQSKFWKHLDCLKSSPLCLTLHSETYFTLGHSQDRWMAIKLTQLKFYLGSNLLLLSYFKYYEEPIGIQTNVIDLRRIMGKVVYLG